MATVAPQPVIVVASTHCPSVFDAACERIETALALWTLTLPPQQPHHFTTWGGALDPPNFCPPDRYVIYTPRYRGNLVSWGGGRRKKGK